MTEIDTFDFHGDGVSVLQRPDGNWLFLRQLAGALALDPWAQQRNIERSAWSKTRTAVMAVQLPGDSQARQHTLIHERIVPMWLANITTSRIADPDVRERVETYQCEFADALHDYVTKGLAVRGGRSDDSLVSLRDLPSRALRLVADERDRAERAERQLAVSGPLAAAYLDLADKSGGLDWLETAHVLSPITGGMGRTTLLKTLREMRIVQKRKPIPYQRHRRYFLVKIDAHGREVGATAVVPPHGLVWLRGRLIKQVNHQDVLFELSEAS